PHAFDEFSMGRIGTGEGAQAYGHGLYFAEAEPTADWYRVNTANRPHVLLGGEPWNPRPSTPDAVLAARVGGWVQSNTMTQGRQPTMHEAIAGVRSDIQRGLDVAPNAEVFGELLSQRHALDRIAELSPSFTRPGHMYEVNLHARPEQFLDWDLPLSR